MPRSDSNPSSSSVSEIDTLLKKHFLLIRFLHRFHTLLAKKIRKKSARTSKKDFLKSAAALIDDAAAKQFLALKNDSFKLVVDQVEFNVTNQSVEALF